MLGNKVLQVGVPKYQGWKKKKERRRDSTYGQATKGIAEEKAGTSHMGKGTRVLWQMKYSFIGCIPTWKGIDHRRDGSNVCRLQRI